MTPLFMSVLNSTSDWNTKGDHNLFYPLEVNYVIDMITAVPVAMTCHRLGELVCYLCDVFFFRFNKPRRENWWFKPCGRCGWLLNDA